jgi:hypothetical protein
MPCRNFLYFDINLWIYDLFNDALSSSDCLCVNGKMTDSCIMNWKRNLYIYESFLSLILVHHCDSSFINCTEFAAVSCTLQPQHVLPVLHCQFYNVFLVQVSHI